MRVLDHRQKTVSTHQFAMVPRAEIPRSTFMREWAHKTTFDEDYLIPVYVDEVLPGDTFNLRMTAFARMTTPIYPVMDNLDMESFFFFVPNRIVWTNFVKFMGEQTNPADSISYTVPVVNGGGTGYAMGTIFDYMGLPTSGQVTSGTWQHSSLPLRAYNEIYNQWFRDENLQNSVADLTGDGPDSYTNFNLMKRAKKHDYFTSALPWTQKGAAGPLLILPTNAPVKTSASIQVTGTQNPLTWYTNSGALPPTNTALLGLTSASGTTTQYATSLGTGTGTTMYPNNLYADLTGVAANTINSLRLAFQTQKLLERDARGGTRYTELIQAHFGVRNPDARLQRPEYLGGGKSPVIISPIPQTAQTGLTGGTTPLGTLGAHAAVTAAGHGFTASFTEHGYVIGLVNIRGTPTYQQGLARHWSRSTRYDFYWPAFAMLGEQSILNKEIYIKGDANDALTFGYQERWAELRYYPSMITGALRSTYATPLDAWHLAEKFTTLPTLGATFIQANTPVSRVSAAPVANTHFIFDSVFQCKTTRPIPMYSTPGLVDHF